MEDRLPRTLAAILYADVAGYSRLTGEDEDATHRALRQHLDLISATIESHRGQVVHYAGDAVLARFAATVEALSAAVAIQNELGVRNAALPDERKVRFRIGVNLGDVIEDRGDIYGDGVNVAARLEALAEPGGICVSDAVRTAVGTRLDLDYDFMGEQQVKNIAQPVRAYRVVLERKDEPAPPPAPSSPPALKLPDKPSIVVLPFQNMSRDPEQEYFSDGISEDIITDLSKVSGLFVIARSSAFVYKDRAVNVPDACRELGVRFALEGSVRKAGGRVRVTAQLIDGESGGHVWAERYDRDLTDIFEVQDDVTRQIVGALEVRLSEAEASSITGGGTGNVDAHDAFLRGRELLLGVKLDRDLCDRGMACFRRAIELDPGYAGPYAGLAMGHVLDYQNRWSGAPEGSLDLAEHFVAEALARDDNDPFGHYMAAVIAMWRRDYDRWIREADRTLSLNPNYAMGHLIRGGVHIYSGEPSKAVPYIEEAMRLDPAAPHGQYLHFLGTAYFVNRDYEAAADVFRQRVANNPTTDLSRAFLASALGHLDHGDEARRVWRELKEINPRYSFEAHLGRLPFKDPEDAERFRIGLRKAGLV